MSIVINHSHTSSLSCAAEEQESTCW